MPGRGGGEKWGGKSVRGAYPNSRRNQLKKNINVGVQLNSIYNRLYELFCRCMEYAFFSTFQTFLAQVSGEAPPFSAFDRVVLLSFIPSFSESISVQSKPSKIN